MGPWFWFLGRPWVEPRALAFRDAGNFYEPLFAWQANEWRAGRIPLWNPQIDCGVPALADATSSTFYPGKLIFALPLPYRLQYHLYLSGHVLLAALVMAQVSRAWGHSRAAATLAGAAYAYGGGILFLYSNVVFLVGAAWLPAALWATDRVARCPPTQSCIPIIWLAVFISLIVLGGDPQTAYHIVLFAILYLILAVFQRSKRLRSRPPEPNQANDPTWRFGKFCRRWQRILGTGWKSPKPRSRLRVGLLVPSMAGTVWQRFFRSSIRVSAAVGLASLLSAIQILPSAAWTKASWRGVYDQPRSIYELANACRNSGQHGQESRSQANRPALANFFTTPAAYTHASQIYEFSSGPWHWLEFFWPNVSGQLFPINTRWTTVFPGESRTWAPSLYLGLLPVLLAIRAAWRADVSGSAKITGCQGIRLNWLRWLTFGSLLGSCGWYGLGWLIGELQWALTGEMISHAKLHAPAGGLYWIAVVLLPGYVYFRYPAKLLVITACGLSLLAARGWDQVFLNQSKLDGPPAQDKGRTRYGWQQDEAFGRTPRSLRLASLSLAMMSLGGLLVHEWYATDAMRWLSQAPIDAAYGPLDRHAVRGQVRESLLHTLLISFAIYGLLQISKRSYASKMDNRSRAVDFRRWDFSRFEPAMGSISALGLLLLTMLDLAWAGSAMTESVPAECLQSPAQAYEAIMQDQVSSNSLTNPRLANQPRSQDRGERILGEASEVSRKNHPTDSTEHFGMTFQIPSWRVWRTRPADTYPTRWQKQGSDHRMSEVVAWENASIVPQHHLKTSLGVVGSQSTLISRDLYLFLNAHRLTGSSDSVEARETLTELHEVTAIRSTGSFTETALTPEEASRLFLVDQESEVEHHAYSTRLSSTVTGAAETAALKFPSRLMKASSKGDGLTHQLADALSIRYQIGPAEGPSSEEGDASLGLANWQSIRRGDGWQLFRDEAPWSTAWIVRNIETIPSPATAQLEPWARYAEQIRFPNGQPRDFRHSAVVDQPVQHERLPNHAHSHRDLTPLEAQHDRRDSPFKQNFSREPDTKLASTPGPSIAPQRHPRTSPLAPLAVVTRPRPSLMRSPATESRPAAGDEFCELRMGEPQRVQLEVLLHQPALIVLNHLYASGWVAESRKWTGNMASGADSGQQRKILRTNLLMRGVWLPAGHHQVDFYYRPLDFYWGAGLSLTTLVGLTGWLIVRCPRDRFWRCVGNLHRLFLRVVLFLCVAALGTTIARGTTDGHGKTRMEACYGIFVGEGRDAGFAYEGDAWVLGGGV